MIQFIVSRVRCRVLGVWGWWIAKGRDLTDRSWARGGEAEAAPAAASFISAWRESGRAFIQAGEQKIFHQFVAVDDVQV